MVQFQTTRGRDRSAPGFVFSPMQERSTDSLYIPYNLQTLTATFGGTDPAVVGDYTVTIPLPSSGTYTFTFTSAGAALAATGPLFAAAWNADPVVGALYFASSSSAVVNLLAKSSNVSIPAASFVVVVPGTTTLAVAQTVASAAQSLRMGLLFGEDTAPSGLNQAITGAPVDCIIARALTGSDTAATIRGMVARPANQAQMSPDFLNTQPDQYVSGQVGFGLRIGEGALIVDPASGVITPATANIYAVLAVGAFSIVGAITDTADGGNTVQINSGANPFLRVVAAEETPVFQSPQTRLARCRLFRAN